MRTNTLYPHIHLNIEYRRIVLKRQSVQNNYEKYDAHFFGQINGVAVSCVSLKFLIILSSMWIGLLKLAFENIATCVGGVKCFQRNNYFLLQNRHASAAI